MIGPTYNLLFLDISLSINQLISRQRHKKDKKEEIKENTSLIYQLQIFCYKIKFKLRH